MLNDLLAFIRRYDMLRPGDRVVCAVSGGADSMALLFAMYLLADKLSVTVTAAHFNHHLRGEESDRDARFVENFCRDYQIPCCMGEGTVIPGQKGLEAAAREARYAYLKSIPGKLATAHTADDNAETVLMHLVRGTGLKGLGGITPVSQGLIRPMLSITRQQVVDFLAEYSIPYVEDSSNHTDQFLRNRLRHNILPLLKQENPRLAENVSAMALRLREDETALEAMSQPCTHVPALRQLHPAQRSRSLAALLRQWGVREPEAEHIALLESLVFSDKPSAKASFPGNITVARNYDTLERCGQPQALVTQVLPCPGSLRLPGLRLEITCTLEAASFSGPGAFTVIPQGNVYLRSRAPGDTIRLSCGTKQVKKLFIDRKIPAAQRDSIPVVADDLGVLGIYGIGANLDRLASGSPGVTIRFENLNTSGVL